MNRIFVSIVLLFIYINVFSQVVKVPLITKFGTSNLPGLLRGSINVKDIHLYKGFDTIPYRHWAIKFVIFKNEQEYIEDFNFTKKIYKIRHQI